MKTCPIIVIGHVDHGKTALVRMLTGMETNRLPEERRRGVSIEPGFAFRQYGDYLIDFIDAPGHERYVKAMARGASGAQAAILVVSAVDGIQPQTREHLEIITLLGIQSGIVAVTKSDLLPESDWAMFGDRLRGDLADTALADASIIFCSSITGMGATAIGDAMQALALRPHGRAMPVDSFLSIDRVFTIDGRGTVVTGTLQGDAIATADILTMSRTGETVAVKSLQTRGKDVAHASPGERVALNLRTISTDAIERGDVITAPGAFGSSDRCDVALSLLPDGGRGLKHMDKIRILHGTADTVATVRLYEQNSVPAGATAFAQLHFSRLVTTYAGQHIILRQLSPMGTLGGATILDPLATRANAKGQRLVTLQAVYDGNIAAIADALAAEYGGAFKLDALARLARQSVDYFTTQLGTICVILPNGMLSTPACIAKAKADYIGRLKAYHSAHPIRPYAPRREIQSRSTSAALITFIEDELQSSGEVLLHAAHVALSTHDPVACLSDSDRARMDDILTAVRRASLRPPALSTLLDDDTDNDLVDLLVHTRRLVRLYNVSLKQVLLFHADMLAAAAETLRAVYAGGALFSTGEARITLDTTRKYIVPILEHFDDEGITVRIGDKRHVT